MLCEAGDIAQWLTAQAVLLEVLSSMPCGGSQPSTMESDDPPL